MKTFGSQPSAGLRRRRFTPVGSSLRSTPPLSKTKVDVEGGMTFRDEYSELEVSDGGFERLSAHASLRSFNPRHASHCNRRSAVVK